VQFVSNTTTTNPVVKPIIHAIVAAYQVRKPEHAQELAQKICKHHHIWQVPSWGMDLKIT
jgi:hypothetical protein